MLEESEPHPNGPTPVGHEKGAVVANILKGYEDFTLDITGKIISSNLEAVNITGYEEWEIMGRNFSIFYTDQDKRDGQPEHDLTRARSDNRLTFSNWRVKKRNVTFWAQITMSSMKDDDGHVTGYKMILKDQTHRLISNNRVKRFRDEYLNLFNNPFIGIFKFKLSDYRFLLVNNNANEIIGGGKDPIKFNEIFINNQDLRLFLEILNKNKQITGFEFQVNLRNSEKWARIDCRIFESEGFGEGVITDITESKKQIMELKRVNDDLDNFIYHASHDLRSPLTTLLGLINLAEVDRQTEVQKYCTMMRERVTYLDELLRELTSITFNSKSEVSIAHINFSAITQRLVREFQPLYANVQVIFRQEGTSVIYSDEHRIQIIFKNLILLAFKYHNPNATPPYVNILVEAHNEKAFIKIEDNGRGIREDQLLQVFGMFYKASDEVRESGLSLYITKLIIDKLLGKIRVKSKIGEGTEFIIELPSLTVPVTQR